MQADRTAPVAGIVLAAGTSTRMGRNKLFFELEGETLLRRAVRRASAAGLDPVIVVLGQDADRARAVLSDIPCRPIVNPDYAGSINLSVRTGLRAVPPEVGAAVVILADMPFVTGEMIAKLVAEYRINPAPLVVSDYGGVNAPPALYDRSLFGELLTMEGEGCGKQVVKRHRSEARSLSWPVEALADLDVPEDYERLKAARETP